MRKGFRGPARSCRYCDQPVKENWYNGIFKGYAKTCPNHHGYDKRKGKDNPAWRGGRTIDKNGYVKILDQSVAHRRGIARYLFEHRVVAEQKLGRSLQPDEIVHHLNGIRDDNRPENLAVIQKGTDGKTNHESWTYVKALQARIRELEAQSADRR